MLIEVVLILGSNDKLNGFNERIMKRKLVELFKVVLKNIFSPIQQCDTFWQFSELFLYVKA